MKYSVRDVSSDGKNWVWARLSFSIKGFLYVNNHCWRLQITTLISESHERSTEGNDVRELLAKPFGK